MPAALLSFAAFRDVISGRVESKTALLRSAGSVIRILSVWMGRVEGSSIPRRLWRMLLHRSGRRTLLIDSLFVRAVSRFCS